MNDFCLLYSVRRPRRKASLSGQADLWRTPCGGYSIFDIPPLSVLRLCRKAFCGLPSVNRQSSSFLFCPLSVVFAQPSHLYYFEAV